jgi:hypothetical protein
MEKALAILLGGFYWLLGYQFALAGMFFPVLFFTLIGVIAVWFHTEIGSFVGPQGRNWLRTAFPTRRVRWICWAFLLGAPAAFLGVPYILY